MQGKPGAPGVQGPVGPKGERGERVSTLVVALLSSLPLKNRQMCYFVALSAGFLMFAMRLKTPALIKTSTARCCVMFPVDFLHQQLSVTCVWFF